MMQPTVTYFYDFITFEYPAPLLPEDELREIEESGLIARYVAQSDRKGDFQYVMHLHSIATF